MKREIERLSKRLSGARMFAAPADRNEPKLYAQLIDNELDPMLAQAVAQGVCPRSDLRSGRDAGPARGARAVVALVGPPGVGQDHHAGEAGGALWPDLAQARADSLRPTCIRIAAADQLRSLASILGIGCDVVETPVALAQALEEHRSKDFVFIDTPGLARGEMEDGADLARLIAIAPGDRHAPGAAGVDEAGRHGARDRALRNLSTRRSSCSRSIDETEQLRRARQRSRAARRCRFRSWRPASRFPTIWSRRRRPGWRSWCWDRQSAASRAHRTAGAAA